MAKQGQTGAQGLEGQNRRCQGRRASSPAGKGLPPVHLWNPPFCGDLDMRIASDGTWFYMGTPIGRPALVRLFSTILKREDGKHFLVTPVEKVGIRVDDAPFLAVEMQNEAGDRGAAACASAPMSTTGCHAMPDIACDSRWPADGGLTPYLHVRADLWAKVTRALYYDLVDMGEERVVDGQPHVRGRIRRRILCHGRCEAGEGRALNEPILKDEPAAIGSAEFFARCRARLNFDVPPGLVDPDIIPRTGDTATTACSRSWRASSRCGRPAGADPGGRPPSRLSC